MIGRKSWNHRWLARNVIRKYINLFQKRRNEMTNEASKMSQRYWVYFKHFMLYLFVLATQKLDWFFSGVTNIWAVVSCTDFLPTHLYLEGNEHPPLFLLYSLHKFIQSTLRLLNYVFRFVYEPWNELSQTADRWLVWKLLHIDIHCINDLVQW